jgi:cytochrome P450
VYWTPFGTTFNPFRRWLSPRPLVQKYNSYRMNKYLDGEIDKRFEELALSRLASSKESQAPSRSIISLAMDKYLQDYFGSTGELSKKTFKDVAKPQLRMFLYAGHDTTSSTLLYCFLLLSNHPDVIAKLRAEHNMVFGADFSIENCNRVITRDPTLLNQLPYTLAVIKEVLRIFPPAGSMREGRPDLTLTDQQGRQYPTEGCNIWTLSLAMHHSDAFVEPEEFIPDRWLVDPTGPLYPAKGSWRAFEWGPRACIGQTLAQMELKIALVMTARLFDITPAYEQWDELHPRDGIKSVDGNRVYQSEMGGGGSHPVDGFPVKVAVRN